MKEYVKTDVPNLVKDPTSGAILNTDLKALEAFRKKKALSLDTEKRLNKLESDLTFIKGALEELLRRN